MKRAAREAVAGEGGGGGGRQKREKKKEAEESTHRRVASSRFRRGDAFNKLDSSNRLSAIPATRQTA